MLRVDWQKGESRFTAYPEAGGRLAAWSWRGLPIIYWPTAPNLKLMAKVRGGNPLLFPFAGRSHAGGREGFWRNPQGAILPISQHGFARSSQFALIEKTDEGFAAELVQDGVLQQSYPYKHRFSVDYRFEAKRLKVRLQLENLSTEAIPWAPGHHFYFGLPFVAGGSRSDWKLEHLAKRAYRHMEDGEGSLSEEEATQPLDFGDPAISNRILAELQTSKVCLVSEKHNFKIEVLTKVEREDLLAVVVWTENQESPFYCVEPWYGLPNAGGGKGERALVPPGGWDSMLVEIRIVED